MSPAALVRRFVPLYGLGLAGRRPGADATPFGQNRRMPIRHEAPADAPVIARIVERAFADHPHSQGTEVAIVRGLRAAAGFGAA